MSQNARPTYRFATNATSNAANVYGNYILKRGAGEIRKPSWERTDTVVRFLPCWDAVGQQWSPFRLSPGPMEYGDWLRRYDAVRGFGENGITMLLNDPLVNDPYDLQTNPCTILYRAINTAIDNRQSQPDWPALLKGGPGRRAPLSRNVPLYLARCAIFRIKSKDMATDDRSPLGLAGGDPGYFLEMPKTVGEKLVALLETRNEDLSGFEPDDYDNVYAYGDIISLDKGAYVTIFEEGADPRTNQAPAPGSAPRQLAVGGGGRGNYGGDSSSGSKFKGYDMFISKEWNGYSASFNTPELEQLIKSKQKPWEDCLQFFSHQEQAFLVQDGFPPSAILYAWRDHPEWIKDETRAKAVGRVSATIEQPVGGNTAGSSGGSNTALPRVSPVVKKSVHSNGEEEDKTTGNKGPVGGWGNKPAVDEEIKDSVVPPSLPEAAVSTESVDDALNSANSTREAQAVAALAAARKRASRK